MRLNRWVSVSLLAILVVLISQCAHQSKKPDSAGGDHQAPNLTHAEAQARSKYVANVDYELEFDLSSPGDRYSGRAVIQFITNASGRDLKVDFAGGAVRRLSLNGKPLEPNYNGRFLTIPGSVLEKGVQRLEVEFDQEYSRQSRGLNRFVDPVDKNVYLYTDFQPFDANRAFPCFDQPDLKATYTLKVKAPKNWEVISSVREIGAVETAPGVKEWTFPRSARFSTYIFPLHAGPYAKWEDRDFRIPLRLFARRSLAAHVNPREWFPITRHGFDFFDGYFSYPYPYRKYDQLVVPEFMAGAMENVAAVTFSELFITRGPKTRDQLRGLADTILHEMAHMWFGNLVTMRWWGDLWLNESFATYMASVAMAASSDFPESWHQFFAGKSGAYHEDQMVTTHPVVAKVNDTNEAYSSFDSITYGKGASVLKQMHYTIGDQAFRKGLATYFDRHAEKNAEYRDFMAAMSEASGRDLDGWSRQWFETAGLNGIRAQFECREDRISQFAILQSAPSGAAIMRPHAFEVALLRRSNRQVKISDQFRIEVSSPTTFVPEAIGKPCPHVVYPNLRDHGYFKVILDERSMNGLKYSLNEVEDPLLRHQLWYAMWDKVRDAQLSFIAFGDLLVPEAMAKEQNDLILRQLQNSAAAVLEYFYQTPTLEAQLRSYSERLDQVVWQRLKTAKPGSNDQLVWLDAMTSGASSSVGRSHVKRLLRGQESIKGLKFDQDRRWDALINLARFSDEEVGPLIDREAKLDPSSQGVEKKLAALAARPIWDEKLKWINEYKGEKSPFSFAQFRIVLWNLFPPNQADLRTRYSEQFFKDLVEINAKRENFVASLFSQLAPNECQPDRAGQIERFVGATPTLKPIVAKNLKIAAQEGERCRKIIGLAEKGARFSTPQ